MLKKRIIPCFDIKNGRTVKGINFLGLRDAGDPVELAREYVKQGADELVFLDISATNENRATQKKWVEAMACEINVPFTVGGGIRSVQDAHELIKAGADKVSLNSAAVHRPDLITEIAGRFGSQCTVVAIDIKKMEDEWYVFVNGGRTKTELKAVQWARAVEANGAGEILLTVMDNDGTKNGFAVEITDKISKTVNIPVIASGGAGAPTHFSELFRLTDASAALAASVFHFKEIQLPDLKEFLSEQNIPVRK